MTCHQIAAQHMLHFLAHAPFFPFHTQQLVSVFLEKGLKAIKYRLNRIIENHLIRILRRNQFDEKINNFTKIPSNLDLMPDLGEKWFMT